MMRITLAVLVLVLFGSIAPIRPGLPAQDPTPAPAEGKSDAANQEKPATPLFTDAEVEVLARSLSEWRAAEDDYNSAKDGKAQTKAKEALTKAQGTFTEQFEKLKVNYKDQDVLRFVDAWLKVFVRTTSIKKQQKPEGTGRVQDKKRIELKYLNKDIAFEYAYFVPQLYDGRKSWPVIVCLHDKGSDGGRYLNEIWFKSTDPELKALREQFIFVAPSIGERTVGKDNREQLRIEWFDKLHIFAIYRCLLEMLNNYNIDTSRIYLEGCGVGGQTAAELSFFRGRMFAAVAARSAEPKSARFCGNLQSQSPLLLVSRKDGPFASGNGAETRKLLTTRSEELKLPIEFLDFDPIPKTNARQAMGTQSVDPVHDSSLQILKFFEAKSRTSFPTKVRFASNNLRLFNRGAWAIVIKGDADPGRGSELELSAEVDRESNTINCTTTNVETFRLLINDSIVDMDRAVKVVVNGKQLVEQKVERTLSYLLNSQKENMIDPHSIMTGEIQVQVPLEPDSPAPAGGSESGK